MPKDTQTPAAPFPITGSLPVIVIGAGIGGLASALRLASAGHSVQVFEAANAPGGKMRTLPSAAGPVDAGPTVLTLRHVFEDLFATAGSSLAEHVTLHKQSILARHFWPDGSTLDLHANHRDSVNAIHKFAGIKAAKQFRAFTDRCQKLFTAFDAPMMQAAAPSLATLTARVMKTPSLLKAMSPLRTMAQQLSADFDDPRLAQLFGRYATYVGGSPTQSPALLTLIWQAEAAGVWTVSGGMHSLARAIADLAADKGVQFNYGTKVDHIETRDNTVQAVITQDGTRHPCAAALFNGDPRALATGHLGTSVTAAGSVTKTAPRSHSAQVWSFAARPTGVDLAHHNVFFSANPTSEFEDLKAGRTPKNPSLYICAMDRGDGHRQEKPGNPERFEIILNAPPISKTPPHPEEFKICQTRTFQTLARMGLHFDAPPQLANLTTPHQFDALFPASLGSLYGQSPHGMTASLRRPKARTPIKGLYLVGGGTHPGAGVPMATLSAKHAAEAITQDQTSTSTSRQMATLGGTSTE